MKQNLKCSHPDHKNHSKAKGWNDGVLATVEGARIPPKFHCVACAQVAQAEEAKNRQPSITERLDALEATIAALKKG